MSESADISTELFRCAEVAQQLSTWFARPDSWTPARWNGIQARLELLAAALEQLARAAEGKQR